MATTNERSSRGYMTADQGHALVADWRRSGLGPTEFCRTRGVTVNRLAYWRSKVAPEVDFIEAVVEELPAPPEAAETTEAIEVMVGDVFVRLPDRPGRAAEILTLLGKAVR